jgi:hypothetical protein
MGMFDYVRCDAPLPDGFTPGDEFAQTKDTDCEMVTHTITADGRFMRSRIVGMKDVPKAERPYPDAPDGDLRALVGSIRTITEVREDTEMHGYLVFYYYSRERGLRQYRAKFTDGRLARIIAVADDQA